MTDYFVCLENRIGEAEWTRFDSADEFKKWYETGSIVDKENTPVMVAYPRIPYQGTDEKKCRDTAIARNQRLYFVKNYK